MKLEIKLIIICIVIFQTKGLSNLHSDSILYFKKNKLEINNYEKKQNNKSISSAKRSQYFTRAMKPFFSLGGLYSFHDVSSSSDYSQRNGIGIISYFRYLWYNFSTDAGFSFTSFDYYSPGQFDVIYHNRTNKFNFHLNHLYLMRPKEKIVGLIGLSFNASILENKSDLGGIVGIEFVPHSNFSIDLRYQHEFTVLASHIQLSVNISK